ncbi:MAG: HRDC domain-containing protein, partial [Planctomycetota bacterium]|nr:HRDC domain-containing protein [Planctomycetota bacterium]
DTVAVEDIRRFWEVLAQPGHRTIAHAARSEVEFSLHAIGRAPAGLIDVQIAAGLVGIEYPAGYGSLMSKVLGQKTSKHETRTDWRRRPLSHRQIEYALDDVRHLGPLCDKLLGRIEELDRTAWLEAEMETSLAKIHHATAHERWRRISGSSGLSRRCLAVLRELWRWRESEAQSRDRPARRVLRDDLMVELARRHTADPKRIVAVRGFERRDLRQLIPAISESIERALELPEEEYPRPIRHHRTPQLPVLGQFLFAALGSICRQAELAPALVGTPNDVRDLVDWRSREGKELSRPGRDPADAQERSTHQAPGHDPAYTADKDPSDHHHHRTPPSLAVGWRAEVVGNLFDDLISGKVSIRITDPFSDHPLVFERNGTSSDS